MFVRKLILFSLIFFSIKGLAQNIIKVNPLGLIYTNVPIYYEREIIKPISVQVGLGIKVPKQLSSFQKDIFRDITSINISDDKFSPTIGFSFTPEFKFYPLRTDTSSTSWDGLYLSLYGRYAHYQFSITDKESFYDYKSQTSINYNYKLTPFLKDVGAGIEIGYQWVFNSGFTIDWFFFGPRMSVLHLGLDFEEVGTNTLDFDELEDIIDESDVNQTIFISAKRTGEKSMRVKALFPIPNYRFGISFGYNF